MSNPSPILETIEFLIRLFLAVRFLSRSSVLSSSKLVVRFRKTIWPVVELINSISNRLRVFPNVLAKFWERRCNDNESRFYVAPDDKRHCVDCFFFSLIALASNDENV